VPPQSRGPLVPRDRLLARLDVGLEQKVTLVSAPAGFGKTTLASEWIAARRQQNRMPPLARLSLDGGDNDPVRFWRYVLSACRVFGAGVTEPALSVLTYSPQPPFEALLTMLINNLAQLSGRSCWPSKITTRSPPGISTRRWLSSSITLRRRCTCSS
jgi:LuxR family transcriptional regulator, maltose regulon positive regulatory protein